MTLATVVPDKSSGKFVVERVIAFMREIGIAGVDVVVKTDQEPAMLKLRREIGIRKMEFGGRWIEEESPVGSSASNGMVERAIQSVQGQVRVMKGCLEDKWNVDVKMESAVIPYFSRT